MPRVQAQQLVATVLSQPPPLDGQKAAQVGTLVRRAFLFYICFL
ncbi:hypothetical protein bcere0024_048340 [Bacillus cereus Rock4-18]|nr:alpha/beta hydrolase [Bacillus toyonensis]EEL60295.2 hypothetical protein bcere0024_048340 [Bacillus cereus Rock4-18]